MVISSGEGTQDTLGSGTMQAWKTQATHTIPIVFVGVTEPVAMGLVASVARPGGNVTGVTSQADLAFLTKRLQLLLEAVPSVARVAW